MWVPTTASVFVAPSSVATNAAILHTCAVLLGDVAPWGSIRPEPAGPVRVFRS